MAKKGKGKEIIIAEITVDLGDKDFADACLQIEETLEGLGEWVQKVDTHSKGA